MPTFVAAEAGHVVPIIYPSDVSTGVTGDVFSMREYAHASIIFMYGTHAGAPTKILVKECTSKAGGGTLIKHWIYSGATTGAAANADVLGARTDATSAGLSPADTNNTF
jgi:hypothetical protein